MGSLLVRRDAGCPTYRGSTFIVWHAWNFRVDPIEYGPEYYGDDPFQEEAAELGRPRKRDGFPTKKVYNNCFFSPIQCLMKRWQDTDGVEYKMFIVP